MTQHVFDKYENDPEWTVFRNLPDSEGVRQLAHIAGSFASEAYVLQPQLGSAGLDVAFLNLHTTEETE